MPELTLDNGFRMMVAPLSILVIEGLAPGVIKDRPEAKCFIRFRNPDDSQSNPTEIAFLRDPASHVRKLFPQAYGQPWARLDTATGQVLYVPAGPPKGWMQVEDSVFRVSFDLGFSATHAAMVKGTLNDIRNLEAGHVKDETDRGSSRKDGKGNGRVSPSTGRGAAKAGAGSGAR